MKHFQTDNFFELIQLLKYKYEVYIMQNYKNILAQLK